MAARPGSNVTFRHKDDSFHLISGLEACREWVEAVTGEKFASDDFQTSVKDGILLCKTVNAIAPGIISSVNTQSSSFAGRANLEMFLSACKQLGLTEPQLFEIEDLYSRSKLRTVAVTIHWLAYVAAQLDLPHIPPFDPLHLSRMSLPSDQKSTLTIRKPSQVKPVAPKGDSDGLKPLDSASKQSPKEETSAASKPEPVVESDPPAPEPVPEPPKVEEKKPDPPAPQPPVEEKKPEPTRQAPPNLSREMDELDQMMKDLENEPKYQVPTVSAPAATQSPAPSSTPAPAPSAPAVKKPDPLEIPNSPVVDRVSSPRTPNSPVQHRNAPPRWSDQPTEEPSPSGPSGGNAPSQPSGPTGNRPVWDDSAAKDPNLTKCSDCQIDILLGKTAYSHGNGVYCLGCLCGTCGDTFKGGRKTLGPQGRNYCPNCVCSRCSKAITGSFIPAGNQKICLECACQFCRTPFSAGESGPLCGQCRCGQCNTPLNGKYFPTENGGRMCGSCAQAGATRSAPPSNGNTPNGSGQSAPASAPGGGGTGHFCGQCKQALSGSVVEVNGIEFHPRCFLCVDCGREGAQLIQNKPYCNNCHPDKEVCCICGNSLRGGGLEALGRLYHEKCFTCQRCFNPLPGGRFKELDGFALCRTCAETVVSQNISHN